MKYDQLNAGDKAPADIIRMIQRAGSSVATSWIVGAKRENSVSYKEIHLVFADSQEVGIRVKSTGDIYQVRINGIVVPIKNQEDDTKAIIEIINKVDAGRTKFQKKITRVKVDMPTGLKSTLTRKEDALRSKITELDDAIAESNAEIARLSVLDDADECGEYVEAGDIAPEDDFDVDEEWEAMPDEDNEDDEKEVMDGDFPGHPFRGNQYKKAHETSGGAVRASKRAKKAEKEGDATAIKNAHHVAHLQHTAAAMSVTTASAQAYHKKMAAFHGKSAGLKAKKTKE